jgi:hypothetical protein
MRLAAAPGFRQPDFWTTRRDSTFLNRSQNPQLNSTTWIALHNVTYVDLFRSRAEVRLYSRRSTREPRFIAIEASGADRIAWT